MTGSKESGSADGQIRPENIPVIQEIRSILYTTSAGVPEKGHQVAYIRDLTDFELEAIYDPNIPLTPDRLSQAFHHTVEHLSRPSFPRPHLPNFPSPNFQVLHLFYPPRTT